MFRREVSRANMISADYEKGDIDMCLEDSEISCGVKQISGVSRIGNGATAEEAMFELVENEDSWSDSIDLDRIYPFYLFSDTVASKGGRKFAKFILDNELGSVYKSSEGINPNTQNKIEVFVWTPNKKKLTSWYNKLHKQWEKAREAKELADDSNWDD